MSCPHCRFEVPEGSRFCPSCGTPLEKLPSTITKAGRHEASTPTPPTGGPRFSPGETLAGRYRIIHRIGKGGMGEVYLADDLELDQPVALKFLPEDVEENEDRLRRFRREVRTARQIAHPNVCRVYDIGEIDGRYFLSMEHIDGEDLGSLLRRIGRLPTDKAVEIARQICTGLAAAHEKGVLHRDLKPANVMIDGRGKARLTDFGLAAIAEDIEGEEIKFGTPAYMAPEQLAGREVSVASDIYSLGLVLYEIFTGKAAFDAPSLRELVNQRTGKLPNRPSSLVSDLDPSVEHVILRCLETNPKKRPRSAVSVAIALPGTDPLAAALAAGRTPSPEMVADAGEVGSLRPAAAWTALSAIATGLAVLVLLSGRTQLSRLVPLPSSPEVLSATARGLVRNLGYDMVPRDSAHGFSHAIEYLEHIARNDPSATRWDRLTRAQPPAIVFWYRQSPYYLVPYRLSSFMAWEFDPPALASGMIGVELDPEGHLRRFEAVPPERDLVDGHSEPDWGPLFDAAGLDLTAFERVEPNWLPPEYADHRAAWEGTYPDASDIPIRVEAAAYRSRPVSFRIIDPWTRPSRMELAGSGQWVRASDMATGSIASLVHVTANLLALLGGALLARRNLRLGRGDRRGAFRLAGYMFCLMMLWWLFGAHHVPTTSELDILYGGLYRAFFLFGTAWLFYMALEPYIRRVWPQMMVSWMRLLDGRLRDPLVGRDILIGCLMGLVQALILRGYQFVPTWLGAFAPRPDRMGNMPVELTSLRGFGHSVAQLFAIHSNTLITCLYFIVALFLLRFILRKTWVAVVVWWMLFTIVYNVDAANPYFDWTVFGAIGILWLFVVFRFGWISVMVGTFIMDVLLMPLTGNPSAWYVETSVLALGVTLGLAVYSFRVALAGRPAFGEVLADR